MKAKIFVFALCLFALGLDARAASAGTVLIRADEAALPAAPPAAGIALTTRGITRRPNVVLVSPAASVTSPFNLELKFEAHGGSTIKPNSFQVLYLKKPNVDLTARVIPYTTPMGVNMVGAEAPPGKHTIKVKIVDSDGREGSAVFVVNVLK